MSFTEHNVNGVIFDTAGTLSVGGVRHASPPVTARESRAVRLAHLASNRGDREENILENYRRLGAAVGFDASRAVGCRRSTPTSCASRGRRTPARFAGTSGPTTRRAHHERAEPAALCLRHGLLHDHGLRPDLALHRRHPRRLARHGERHRAQGARHDDEPFTARTPTRCARPSAPPIGKCCFETDSDVADAFFALLDPAMDERIEKRGDILRRIGGLRTTVQNDIHKTPIN